AELAQQVGCVVTTIKKIEADARRPSRQLAERLADLLQVAPDERAAFIKAARAELVADQLPLAGQPIDRALERVGSTPARMVAHASEAAPAATPDGTVTFLFTDIEGSPQLGERPPEAMPAALARHDTILRAMIEAQGGHVFKTVGDAFCGAFATAADGL